MFNAEQAYNSLIALGCSPEQAREVLPNSCKTELVVTANLREWRHIFKQRTSKHAQAETRKVMLPLLDEFKSSIPVLFDDIKGVRNE